MSVQLPAAETLAQDSLNAFHMGESLISMGADADAWNRSVGQPELTVWAVNGIFACVTCTGRPRIAHQSPCAATCSRGRACKV